MRCSNHFGFFTGQEQACSRPVDTGSIFFEQVVNEQKGDITRDIAGGKFTFVQVREIFKKSKWKFKMAFAIRRPIPPPP